MRGEFLLNNPPDCDVICETAEQTAPDFCQRSGPNTCPYMKE